MKNFNTPHVEEMIDKYLPSASDEVNDKLTQVVNDFAWDILRDMGMDNMDPDIDWTDEHHFISDQLWNKILRDLKV